MGQACSEKSLRLTIILLGLFACSLTARAEDIQWSGFFSTGIAFSDQSVPYSDNAIVKEPNIGHETTLGLNLAKALSPSLTMAAQVLANEDNADSALKADWAFVTYTPIAGLELTVGKQKLPMWLVSSYIDVDALYPWAHPPDEVYLLFPLKTFTGASVRYSLPVGPTILAIQPYGGEATTEVAPSAPTADSKVRAQHMFGTSVEWTWNKTVARAAYNRAMWDLDFGDTLKIGQRRFELMSYGLQSEWHHVMLMAEYATTKDLDDQKYQDLSKELAGEAVAAANRGDKEEAGKLITQALVYGFHFGGSKAYYVTAGYQFTHMALYLTQANLKKTPMAGASEDQSSTALGVNIEPDETSVVKLEAKRIALPNESRGLFKDPTKDELKGLNGAMIYSVNYSLTF